MLLGLRIRGFKNLRDVRVRFGPLTCFLGPNGVGKSNIFDAIQFLRHLADLEIHEAAERIRRPAAGGFSPLDLFWNRDPTSTMEFEADLLLPPTTTDDFGVEARATTTLVRYRVAFGWEEEERRLVLREEELKHRRKSEARAVIGFPHGRVFRDSVVLGDRKSESGYISTKTHDGLRIELHQDGGSRGRPIAPGRSPRTVLGGTNTADYPTVLCARREMASWCLLQLEPSSLRAPDRLGDRGPIDELGRHIAGTLARLASRCGDRERVLAEAGQAVRRLVPTLRELRLQEDLARDQIFVEARFQGSDLWLPPRALSEGTLRFLAMTVLQMDAASASVLCIEEPENGIHPSGLPRLVDLLRDYAVDPDEAAEPIDNPLRQVVVNSHSPQLANLLRYNDVLFVEAVETAEGMTAQVRAIEHDADWRKTGDAVTVGHFKEVVGGSPIGQPNLPY